MKGHNKVFPALLKGEINIKASFLWKKASKTVPVKVIGVINKKLI